MVHCLPPSLPPPLSLFSYVFTESSLTPENLLSVLDCMDDILCLEMGRYANIPMSELFEIDRRNYSVRECKEAVILHLISIHPALSWRLVANALYKMAYEDAANDNCHRALDCLQQRFPTGNKIPYMVIK